MANVFITPNMSLPSPVPGIEPGPQWATDNSNCLSIIDAHNHAPGSGVQINPAGININADLPFNGSNAISLRSTRFSPQGSPIAASGSDIGCLYEAGVDLYYNDGAGNQIRITQSGSVSGSSGTITGLPSGTASAAFSAVSGSFIFQQATSTGANLDVASIAIRYPGSYPTPSGNYIQIQAPSSLASGFSFTLPGGLPGSNNSLLGSSTAGIISYIAPNTVAAAMSSPKFGGVPIVGTENNSLVASRDTTSQNYIISGLVNVSGGIVTGVGFSSSRTSTGTYVLTFTNAFSSLNPCVVATPDNSVAAIRTVPTAGNTCTVLIYSQIGGSPVLADSSFSFIAIGVST